MESPRRIERCMSESFHSKAIAIYGPGAGDKYLTVDYREVDVDQILFEYLRASGFKRIAFWSPENHLYFYDDESRSSVLYGGSTSACSQGPLAAGPMGARRGLGFAAAAPTRGLAPDIGPVRT